MHIIKRQKQGLIWRKEEVSHGATESIEPGREIKESIITHMH